MQGKYQIRDFVKQLMNKSPRLFTLMYYGYYKLTHMDLFSQFKKVDPQKLKEIDEKGFTIIPNYLSEEECNRCINDIEWIMENKKEFVAHYSDKRIFGAENLSKNIMHFASDQLLINLCEQFMCVGMVNGFTMANKVESKPGSKGSGDGWHKDMAFRQFKAILYLNKVTEKNGPFQIIEGSHRLSSYLSTMKRLKLKFGEIRISDEKIDKVHLYDKLRTIIGTPGTLVLANTACIHRGCPPIEGERYALTNYYMEKYQVANKNFFKVYKTTEPEKIIKMKQNWNLRHQIAREFSL